MEKSFDREFLLNCASEFLKWMALQDPAYKERIQVTKDERQIDDLQVLASYVSRVLDLGEHMYYCEREFMAPNYAGHLGPRACIVCDVNFTPNLATDEVCDKIDCRNAFYAVLDKKFEVK